MDRRIQGTSEVIESTQKEVVSGGEMAAEIPIRRLLAYQDATARLRDRGTVSRAEFLDNLADVTRNDLASDLELLGISDKRGIRIQEFDLLISVATNSFLGEGVEVPIRICGEPDTASLHRLLVDKKAHNISRAAAREAAFAFGQTNPDHLLLALGCMENDRCAYRHQVEGAKKIVEEMHACGIVADEVGLGKTITGALILLELIHRGLVNTSLILVPGNLLKQWIDELKVFFGFEPLNVKAKGAVAERAIAQAEHLILDMDKAKSSPYKDILLQRAWGCLLIDEAHRLRNHDTARSRFCYSLKSTFRALLTATPVHNSAFDIYTQVTSLRPGALGPRDAYRELYISEDNSIYNPILLQKKIEETVSRVKRAHTELRFAERRIVPIAVENRPKLEKQLYTDLLRFLRGSFRRHISGAVAIKMPLGTERYVSVFVLVAILVLREMGSHPRAALKTLDTALRRRLEELADITGDYVDVDLLDKLLHKYATASWGEGTHGKTDELVRRIPEILDKTHKCIIYTEFLETLRALQAMIETRSRPGEHSGFDLVIYHGMLSRANKTAAIARFENTPRPSILLSTDCGGEGLNLQAAGCVINYDFPWNPMRIEQRIGRIDRIGQTRKQIYIYNFITKGTIESYVYAVLEEKLDVCRDILGDFTSPITRLMIRRPMDLGIGEIILSCENDDEMARRFESFSKDIDVLLDRGKKYDRREGWI